MQIAKLEYMFFKCSRVECDMWENWKRASVSLWSNTFMVKPQTVIG